MTKGRVAAKAVSHTFFQVKRMVRAGALPKAPLWYKAMETVPPMNTMAGQMPSGKVKKIIFPTDELEQIYHQRNPDAFLEPIRALHPEQWTRAQEFANRQLELMTEQGMSQEDAYKAVEDHFKGVDTSRRFAESLARNQAIELGAKPAKYILEKRFEQDLKMLEIGREVERRLGDQKRIVGEMDAIELAEAKRLQALEESSSGMLADEETEP